MSTPKISLSAQDLSSLYTNAYFSIAVCVLLVYDWLLSLGQELRFIWNWRSGGVLNVASWLYVLSRYTLIINAILPVVTMYPMSDLSCRANAWTQVDVELMGLIAFSAFSALRAYALSDRSKWLAAVIIILALPPGVMLIAQMSYEVPENLPSPLYCSASGSVPLKLYNSETLIIRGSQLAAELLVIGITWWYSYQSYRIQKGINLGKTVSSLLLYNGSMYFLFLVTLYILDIIFDTPIIPVDVDDVAIPLEAFIDPITSILVCRFILSLRQFDSTADMTNSGTGSRARGRMPSMVLQFGAQPSDSLPGFIASFAHPVHLESNVDETDPDGPGDC